MPIDISASAHELSCRFRTTQKLRDCTCGLIRRAISQPRGEWARCFIEILQQIVRLEDWDGLEERIRCFNSVEVNFGNSNSHMVWALDLEHAVVFLRWRGHADAEIASVILQQLADMSHFAVDITRWLEAHPIPEP